MLDTFRFIRISIKSNWSAQLSNFPNFLAAVVGMLLNNIIFLMGMWGMIFAGKPENDPLLAYYIALNAVFMCAWGGINFFFGGWVDFSTLIVNGEFESKLATPRHPLLLLGTHSMQASALGDFILGVFGFFVLGWLEYKGAPSGITLRAFFATVFSFVGLFSLYITSGALAFYVGQGDKLALLIREVCVSLGAYPMGKVFSGGIGRLLLLLTPTAAFAILPLDWVEQGGFRPFLIAVFACGISVFLALFVYKRGLKRFQAISRLGALS